MEGKYEVEEDVEEKEDGWNDDDKSDAIGMYTLLHAHFMSCDHNYSIIQYK